MRYFLLSLLIFWTPVLAAPATVESVPNQRQINGSHVSNPDGVVGADAIAQIDNLLISLEYSTGIQVAVVAVDSIGNADVFSFTQALFDRWGIGDEKRDDGLLVLLVKDQNAVRIHRGYGLEGSLPDVVIKRIQRIYMVPAFKEGHYGNGLLAGLNAISGVLADPSSVQALATTESKNINWRDFSIVTFSFGGIALLLVFIIKFTAGNFSIETAQKSDIQPSMYWSATTWLGAFFGGPILVFTVINFTHTSLDSPILVACTTLYGYFMFVAGFQAWRQYRAVHGMLKKGEYFKSYMLTSRQQSFWFWIAVFFPLPFLVHYIFLRRYKAYLRKYPRDCVKCKDPMRRMNEEEENDYLSIAQQMEETLHSADHDVWRCTTCEATTSVAYPGDESKYTKCPHCKTLAFYEESSKILVEPTHSRRGKHEAVFTCQFCGHKKVEESSMNKLAGNDSSSSSSSSNSSPSNNGSWGGWKIWRRRRKQPLVIWTSDTSVPIQASGVSPECAHLTKESGCNSTTLKSGPPPPNLNSIMAPTSPAPEVSVVHHVDRPSFVVKALYTSRAEPAIPTR